MEEQKIPNVQEKELQNLHNKIKVLVAIVIVMGMLVAVMFALLSQSISSYSTCVDVNTQLVESANNFNNPAISEGNVRTGAVGT